MYYTLRFTDRNAAMTIAVSLGFARSFSITEDQATGEVDLDGAPICNHVEVGIDHELIIQGTGTRPDGTIYGWMIDEIGQNPVVTQSTYDEDGIELTPAVTLSGYFVNIVGELPPAAHAYLAPGGYGCAGRVFAGSVD